MHRPLRFSFRLPHRTVLVFAHILDALASFTGKEELIESVRCCVEPLAHELWYSLIINFVTVVINSDRAKPSLSRDVCSHIWTIAGRLFRSVKSVRSLPLGSQAEVG